MSALAEAINQLRILGNVLGALRGVSEGNMRAFDAAMTQFAEEADGKEPIVVAAAIVVSGLALAAIAPEVLAAGVAAVVGEEAILGAAYLVDEIIALNAPAALAVTSGTRIVATTSANIGGLVAGEAIFQGAERIFDGISKLFNNVTTYLQFTTQNVTDPLQLSNPSAVFAQNDTLSIDSGSRVAVFGNNTNITVSDGSFVSIMGSTNAISAGSSSNLFIASGGSNTANISGNNSSIIDNGTGNNAYLDVSSGTAHLYSASGSISFDVNGLNIFNAPIGTSFASSSGNVLLTFPNSRQAIYDPTTGLWSLGAGNGALHDGVSALPAWITPLRDDFGTGLSKTSPLVLDLDGDGIELTALDTAQAVYWDVNNSGIRQASGWVGADDGLLVIDKNSNGQIDNQSELFGTKTTDGFTVLSDYDSNHDNQITSADTQFGDLRVWQDANADGVSQASELSTLTALGINTAAHSVNVNYF